MPNHINLPPSPPSPPPPMNHEWYTAKRAQLREPPKYSMATYCERQGAKPRQISLSPEDY